MASSVLDQIKSRLDIVDVISGYIKLKKVGVNYRATSPFHQESNPSFFVSPSKQIWHDFSSGIGGDIFKFVMAIEGVDFKEALRILAKKAGVELKQTKQWEKIKTEKDQFYIINELAAQFFEKQMDQGIIGKAAKQYLIKRGLTEETIKEWRIGYAPGTWRGLSDYLIRQKFSESQIERAGLLIRRDGNKSFDRFKGRIMFPINDINGQIAGFTGRILSKKQEEKGMAKYMNIPNTLLYDKSKIIYGIDKAKIHIVKADAVILVEGQMDELMSYQSGVKNVVAISGTALTPSHLLSLKRYTKNLIISFDMDLGGNSATERGIKMALAGDFNVRVVTMPQGQDPADVCRESPNKWIETVGKTKSIVDFYFEVAFSRWSPLDIDGKKKISAMVLPIIAKIPNQIEQMHWVSELSKKIGIRDQAILEELKKYPVQEEDQDLYFDKNEKINIAPLMKSRRQKLEERILALFLNNPEIRGNTSQEQKDSFSLENRDILNIIETNGEISKERKEFLDQIAFEAEIDHEQNGFDDPGVELSECLKELAIIDTKDKMEEISRQIRQCEDSNDFNKAKELCKELQELSKKMIN
ncbi:MAG TPA: DNA primase [Candidatus Pacearchaeota archaeon]|nr:DNA primase [Candidatus Pacearchaeota archaeon]